jgi:hypothetical protein
MIRCVSFSVPIQAVRVSRNTVSSTISDKMVQQSSWLQKDEPIKRLGSFLSGHRFFFSRFQSFRPGSVSFRRELIPWSSVRLAAFSWNHSVMDQLTHRERVQRKQFNSFGRLDLRWVPTPPGEPGESSFHRRPCRGICPCVTSVVSPSPRQSKSRWQPFCGEQELFCLVGTNVSAGACKFVLGHDKRCSGFMEDREKIVELG